MEITVAKYAGFCFGVERAVSTVEEMIKNKDEKKIYTVGTLIHNPEITEKFKSRGVVALEEDDIDKILDSDENNIAFVIRAHGVKKEIEEKIKSAKKERNISLVDCTCPFVSKIHKIMDENTTEDTFTFLFGSTSHPEVIGIASHIKGERFIFDTYDELLDFFKSDKAKDIPEKMTILASQTTQNLSEYKKCQEFIKKVCTNTLIFDTICSVTENRQREVEKISKTSDAVLVIGGKNSSNTKKLYDISKKNNDMTFFVERFCDIPKNITQMSKVGIAAGASTPG